MADHFLSGMPNLKQSFSLSDIDPNAEFLNHIAGINPNYQEFSAFNFHSFIGYPHDNPFPPLSDCTGKLESYPGLDASSLLVPPVSNENYHKDKKRKATSMSTPESSSPQVSVHGKMVKNSSRRGKKVEKNDKERAEENLREVVHVRAKRGQATDSHSLAERVRRGKINERLRHLQDIVPGCYKTMGMAVMLDEIINYVQSLHSQVEFLSMKLTTASMVYDFNSEADAIERVQGLPLYIWQKAKAPEAFKIQNPTNQELTSAQFAPANLDYEFYPPLQHKNS